MSAKSPLPGTIGQTVAAITSAGGTATAIPADLSRQADRQRLVAETTGQLGPPDILVNNAAVTYFHQIEDFTARRYELMFAVQVEAPFQLASLVLSEMRQPCCGLDPQHLLRSCPAPVDAAQRLGKRRRHRVRHVQGRDRAVFDRAGRRGICRQHRRQRAVAEQGRPHAGDDLHHLTTEDDREAEPPAVMAEAALMLCHRDPLSLTGRITYWQDLLTELDVTVPASP